MKRNQLSKITRTQKLLPNHPFTCNYTEIPYEKRKSLNATLNSSSYFWTKTGKIWVHFWNKLHTNSDFERNLQKCFLPPVLQSKQSPYYMRRLGGKLKLISTALVNLIFQISCTTTMAPIRAQQYCNTKRFSRTLFNCPLCRDGRIDLRAGKSRRRCYFSWPHVTLRRLFLQRRCAVKIIHRVRPLCFITFLCHDDIYKRCPSANTITKIHTCTPHTTHIEHARQ
jgi:hypothetical protein